MREEIYLQLISFCSKAKNTTDLILSVSFPDEVVETASEDDQEPRVCLLVPEEEEGVRDKPRRPDQPAEPRKRDAQAGK